MFEDLPAFLVRLSLGLVLGVALGFAARRGRFCTLGAIEDAVYANDTRRLRSWILAIGVAIVGVHALELWGELDLTRSIYLGARLEWGALILGGFLFGIGMALNGTCGFGTLRQLGGGDLKALISFLVIGITAMMTMRGLTGIARISLTDPLTLQLPQGFSQRLPEMAGLSGASASLLAIAIGVAIAAFAFNHRGFRTKLRFAATGAAIGALIVAGWWATGIAGFDSFDTRRIESFTFVGPLGETLYYAMLSTALQPDFPVGAVIGVVLGSFIAARTDGSFKWEAPADANDLKRRLLGAFLMGFGGITALGCTIGQGVTGLSTLSVGSALATVSIVAGARAGLYLLVERKWTFGKLRAARAVPAKAAVGHERISCTDP
ncbi:MAG: YeeE/YedE family protein [Pseudorhodoplanes sp.]|nr:YeeE/YedE family protein [Pseudorhodoplanes sp.]